MVSQQEGEAVPLKEATSLTFSNEDIDRLVHAINQRRGIRINIADNISRAELLHAYNRFEGKENELVYRVTLNREAVRSLPDFLNSLKSIFSYIIDVARVVCRDDEDDWARFAGQPLYYP